MLQLRIREVVGGLAILLLATATWADGQTYPIKLQRPLKVGDTYAMSVTGDMQRSVTITAQGADPKQQAAAYKAFLKGNVQVGAVDDKGNATKLTCTVDQCVLNDQPLFPQGTVLVGEMVDGEPQYTADGKPVDNADVAPLAAILTLADPNNPTDDDAVFGTDTARKVGDTWDVNAAAAADLLGKKSFPLKKEDINGTSKLVSMTKVNGQDVLHVEADMDAPKLSGIQMGKMAITDGSITAHVSGDYPVDPARMPIRRIASVDMSIHGTTQDPNGAPVTLYVQMTYSKDVTMGDVKR